MSDQPPPQERRDERTLPEQVTMGLLPYLTAHAVDEDYAQVAARQREGAVPSPRPPIGVAGAVVLAIFAALAVTAAVQTSRDSVSQERERRALVEQVKSRKAAVEDDRDAAARLRAETDRLEAALVRNTRDSSALLAQLNLLRMRAGTAPVRGPGVEILVDDAQDAETDRQTVLDTDLQKIVNALWSAGAEAISINGERLTALSAIHHGGRAITVNFHRLNRPYRILAIGDPLKMPRRFAESATGRAWLDVQREFGLRFSMRTEGSLKLPAADLPTFRNAQAPDAAQGKRSS